MNERLAQFGLAALALLASWYLLGPGEPVEPQPSRANSEDRGERGLKVLVDWLQHRGLEVQSWRRRFEDLPDVSPQRADLMISHFPHTQPMQFAELPVLKQWVAEGGNLLLVTALDGTRPRGIAATDLSDLLREFEWQDVDAGDPDLNSAAAQISRQTGRMVIEIDSAHPAVNQVQRLVSDLPQNWSGSGLNWLEPEVHGVDLPTLAQWQGPQRPDVFWYAPHQQGRVWLLLGGNLFGNAHIARADNALLIESLARWIGGRVLIDDFHQGLSEIYDPAAFYGDNRLHSTVLWILALWAIVMLGSWRRMLPAKTERRDFNSIPLADGVSQLLARRLAPGDSAELLLQHRLRDWFGRPRLTPQTWLQLRADPRRDAQLINRLEAMYQRRDSLRESELIEFHALLESLRPASLPHTTAVPELRTDDRHLN